MTIEETGEIWVKTDCLNFDVSYAYKFKNLLEEALGLYFCRILGPAAVQDCTKFPRLMTNALLQLVRDIINGVSYQRYEKCLEQQKGRLNVNVCEKKVWKRKCN